MTARPDSNSQGYNPMEHGGFRPPETSTAPTAADMKLRSDLEQIANENSPQAEAASESPEQERQLDDEFFAQGEISARKLADGTVYGSGDKDIERRFATEEDYSRRRAEYDERQKAAGMNENIPVTDEIEAGALVGTLPQSRVEGEPDGEKTSAPEKAESNAESEHALTLAGSIDTYLQSPQFVAMQRLLMNQPNLPPGADRIAGDVQMLKTNIVEIRGISQARGAGQATAAEQLQNQAQAEKNAIERMERSLKDLQQIFENLSTQKVAQQEMQPEMQQEYRKRATELEALTVDELQKFEAQGPR